MGVGSKCLVLLALWLASCSTNNGASTPDAASEGAPDAPRGAADTSTPEAGLDSRDAGADPLPDAPTTDQLPPPDPRAVSLSTKVGRIAAITADSAGNSFVVGQEGDEMFVAQLDSTGNPVWVALADVPRGGGCCRAPFSAPADIAVDSQGNMLITGRFVSSATFGATELKTDRVAAFVAKLDSGGTWLWATFRPSRSYGWGLAVDSAGNAYVAVDGIHVDHTEKVSVVKLDGDGKHLWTADATIPLSSDHIRAQDIAVDAAGNAYVTGALNRTAHFGATTVSGGSFVARVDSSGKWRWAASPGGNAIAVDGAGSVRVAGGLGDSPLTVGSTTLTPTGTGDLFVARLDSQGSWLWAAQASGDGYTDFDRDIAVDAAGNTYVAGAFSGSLRFGAATLTPGSGHGAYVAKLDQHGNWPSAVSSDCSGGLHFSDVFVDRNAACYFTGWFAGTATFGKNTLTSQGAGDWAARPSDLARSAYSPLPQANPFPPVSEAFVWKVR